MSLDSKIAILLSQLKNNPELQSASSTSPKVQSTTLSLEPLFAGLEQNTPMLAGSASLINDPTFLNVELDLFVLLKEQITSTLSLIDILALSQDKGVRDAVNSKEKVSKNPQKPVKDVLEIDHFLQFLKSFTVSDSATFAERQDFKNHKKFLDNLKTLERVSKETAIRKQSLLDVVDKLLETTLHKKKAEKISVQNNVLNPKGFVKTNRIGIISHPPQVGKRSPIREVLDLLITLGFSVTKRFEEDLYTKISILNPKAKVKSDKVSINDVNSFVFNFQKEEVVDLLEKVAKRISLLKNSIVKVRTNTIVARAVTAADKVVSTSTTKKKLSTTQKEVLDLSIFEFFKIGRGLHEDYNIRDRAILTAKAKELRDRFFSVSTDQKKVAKPNSDIADILVRTFITPGLATTDEIKAVSSVLTPKSKILAERLLFDELFVLEMPRKAFETINLQIQLAKFLNKILSVEKTKVRDNTIVSDAKILADKAGVVSKDRDQGGIGDVSFLFATKLVNFVNLIEVVKKEAQKPKSEKLNLRDLLINPKSSIQVSRVYVSQNSHLLFNKVPADIVQIETKEVKDIEKPFLEKITTAISVTLKPAAAQIITNRILATDSFNPYLFNKVPRTIVGADDKEMRLIQEKTGITDTLSSSQVGYAWMRDEEYTRGAYFLQPYVATIPPGRSRQF